MNFRISIGLVISLLVMVGGLFMVNVSSVFAAGFTLYTDTSYCPGCRVFDTWANGAGKSVINNIGGLTDGGGVPPDNGLIPGLFKDGQRVATGSQEIQNALNKASGDIADQKLVGKDVIVGTEQIYVDPLTHEGLDYIPKPSAPQKPPTISLEKQQELARNEASNIPITQVGGEILETHPATVNLGVEVGPGTYQVGKCQKNQSPGTGYVQPDASGNFTSCAEPKAPNPASDSGFGGPSSGCGPGGCGSGGSGGSGAGGLGGGLGGAGGLAALLPLLMSGLLGGGQGNQGNLGNTSGSGQGNVAIPCSAYGSSPVCGVDGQTYTNSCYMQQYGVAQKSVGICGLTSPSSSPVPDVAKIADQLNSSGAPKSLIDKIISGLSSIFGKAPTTITIP